MKKSIIAVGLLAVAMASQNASAKTLEDILKEKGVITEEDYKEVVKSKPAPSTSSFFSYKPGSGISLATEDGNYRLNIGAHLQLRYDYYDADGAANFGTSQDYSKFQFRRAKLLLSGNALTKDLTYTTTINFANSNGGATSNGGLLEETFLNYRIIDEAQLRFGQDKVQFGRGFITSSSKLQFVDVSNITNAFVPGYDTGFSVSGNVLKGIVKYTVGIYGGDGQNTFRASNNNAFSARIVCNPLGDMPYSESDVEYSEKPLVSIAGSYFRDALKTTANTPVFESNQLSFAKSPSVSSPGGWIMLGQAGAGATKFFANEKVNFDLFGADAAFKWRGFSLQGEYFLAFANGQTSNTEQIGQGFYVQAGYFVIPKKLEVAARYAYMDPNRVRSNDNWVETTGAVSYYFDKHNLKVQADYTDVHKQNAVATTTGFNSTDDK